MRKCWHPSPKSRPEFSQLAHEIKDMITMIEQAMKQGQHTTDIQSTYVNMENCTGTIVNTAGLKQCDKS
jgi:methyl-accepting chemotaxis protein